MDFLHDQLASGCRLRVPHAVCGTVGYPRTIRVDRGARIVSRDLDQWACAEGATIEFSRPGKPTDHALADRARAECAHAHWLLN
jgi:putative transposase